LLLGRPVAFYWSSAGPCGSGSCASEVLFVGTPVLWWSFIPALLGLGWFGISRRDWRALAIGLAALAGIVPWFNYELSDRTMFSFYAAPPNPSSSSPWSTSWCPDPRTSPYRRITRTSAGTELLEPADRRLMGTVFAGAYILSVAIIFAYFYPIFVGKTSPTPKDGPHVARQPMDLTSPASLT